MACVLGACATDPGSSGSSGSTGTASGSSSGSSGTSGSEPEGSTGQGGSTGLGSDGDGAPASGEGWRLGGSGGCQSGEGLALLALLVPGLLALRRRPRAVAAVVAAGALAGAAGTARADDAPGLAVQRFQPLGGGSDVLGIASAQVLGQGDWEAAAYANLAHAPLRLTSSAGQERVLVRDQTTLDLVGAVGVGGGLELDLGLPVTVAQSAARGTSTDPGATAPVSGGGLGDLRLTPKVHLADAGSLSLAVAVTFALPTGDGDAFLGAGTFSAAPRAVVEYRFAYGIRAQLNLGALLQAQKQLLNLQLGPALTFGAGAEAPFTLGGQRFSALATLAGEADRFDDAAAVPLELLAGLRWRAPWAGLEATLAGGRGLTAGFGTPEYRALAGPGVHAGL
jgi:hypothetical protein